MRWMKKLSVLVAMMLLICSMSSVVHAEDFETDAAELETDKFELESEMTENETEIVEPEAVETETAAFVEDDEVQLMASVQLFEGATKLDSVEYCYFRAERVARYRIALTASFAIPFSVYERQADGESTFVCKSQNFDAGTTFTDVYLYESKTYDIIPAPEQEITTKFPIMINIHGPKRSGDWAYEELSDGTIEISDYFGFESALVIPTKINQKVFTAIGFSALSGKNMHTVTIPETVTSIGAAAFASCENIETITLPKNLVSLGSSAFCNCTQLTNITIPSGMRRCNQLQDLPKGERSILVFFD